MMEKNGKSIHTCSIMENLFNFKTLKAICVNRCDVQVWKKLHEINKSPCGCQIVWGDIEAIQCINLSEAEKGVKERFPSFNQNG